MGERVGVEHVEELAQRSGRDSVQRDGGPGLKGNRQRSAGLAKRAPLIAALVGATVVVVMVVALVLPKAAQVHTRHEQIAQAQAQEQTLQQQLAQLRADARDAADTRARLVDLQGEVPPTVDLPGLIRLLDDAAAKSDVEWMAMAPAQPTVVGQVSLVPAQITVVGRYFAVDQFLYRLETLSRAARITSVGLTPGSADAGAASSTGSSTVPTTTTTPASTTGGSGEFLLTATLAVEFYTTDTSAGPGSVPGPIDGPLGETVTIDGDGSNPNNDSSSSEVSGE